LPMAAGWKDVAVEAEALALADMKNAVERGGQRLAKGIALEMEVMRLGEARLAPRVYRAHGREPARDTHPHDDVRGLGQNRHSQKPL